MKKLVDYTILDTVSGIGYYKFNAEGGFVRDGDFLSKEVLRYYDEKFRVLNARFVNLSGARPFALSRLRKSSWIIQYLNPNITEDELRVWLRSKVRRYKGDSSVRPSDAVRISKEEFGKVVNLDDIVDYSSIRWMSKYPLSNPYSEGTDEYFDYLVKQRQSFALSCYNSIRRSNSIESFISSYEVAKELYGDVCIDDIASVMGVSVSSARRVLSKIREVGGKVDKPNPDIHNKKYITTQRKIIVGGEEIHFKDKEFITKSRVSRKASVSRPTVNNHWSDVHDYFEELNNKLKK